VEKNLRTARTLKLLLLWFQKPGKRRRAEGQARNLTFGYTQYNLNIQKKLSFFAFVNKKVKHGLLL